MLKLQNFKQNLLEILFDYSMILALIKTAIFHCNANTTKFGGFDAKYFSSVHSSIVSTDRLQNGSYLLKILHLKYPGC